MYPHDTTTSSPQHRYTKYSEPFHVVPEPLCWICIFYLEIYRPFFDTEVKATGYKRKCTRMSFHGFLLYFSCSTVVQFELSI